MEALSETLTGDKQSPDSSRRRRYYPATHKSVDVALTPAKRQALLYLAECRLLSLPQIALLLDLPERSARRHMRLLFDAGLVSVVPVSRAALAESDAPNDASLLYGSAPNVYVPTTEGLRTLYQAGLIDKDLLKRPQPKYGPKNSLFLRHELQVRDVRVWLERCARSHGGDHKVLEWRDGGEAVIELDREEYPRQVRPDAWFVYRVKERPGQMPAVLVGFLEVDRGTERGSTRWQEKIAAYGALFGTTEGANALQAATGYRNARVLVFCPDALRCENLTEMVLGSCVVFSQRLWTTECSTLSKPRFDDLAWRRSGQPQLLPFLD